MSALSLLPTHFAIFNLGQTELVIIGLVALIFFGGRLPEVARSLGRSFTSFKRGLKDVDVDEELDDTDRAPEPKIQTPRPAEHIPASQRVEQSEKS